MPLDGLCLEFFGIFLNVCKGQLWCKLFVGNMWYFGDQIFPVVWPLSLLASSSGFQDELTASDNKVPTEPGATAILQELSAGGLRDTAMSDVSPLGGRGGGGS